MKRGSCNLPSLASSGKRRKIQERTLRKRTENVLSRNIIFFSRKRAKILQLCYNEDTCLIRGHELWSMMLRHKFRRHGARSTGQAPNLSKENYASFAKAKDANVPDDSVRRCDVFLTPAQRLLFMYRSELNAP